MKLNGARSLSSLLCARAHARARARDGVGAQILADLGVESLRLITNSPRKCAALASFGLDVVERVPSLTGVTPSNVADLRAKRAKMGHWLGDLDGELGAES